MLTVDRTAWVVGLLEACKHSPPPARNLLDLPLLQTCNTSIYPLYRHAKLWPSVRAFAPTVPVAYHTVEFEGSVASEIRGLRDQICTT